MTKPKIERKVLRIFGKVIRPANWFIFIAGFLLLILAPSAFWLFNLDGLGVVILAIQGVQLMVEGYGEIKDDEGI